MPLKPIKLTEQIAAATSVIGIPWNALGVLPAAASTRERTPEKSTMASRKPRPDPTALSSDGPKFYPSSRLRMVTPSTAQLVVISGR